MAFLAAIPAMIGMGGAAAGGAAAAGTAAAAAGAATAATTALTAATWIGLAGTALSVVGTIIDTKQQRGAAKANEASAKMEAKQVMEQATENSRRRRVEADSFTSSQVARLGAAGVDFMGSPLDVIFNDSARGELAARDIMYEGQAAAAGKKYEARLSRFKRDQALPMGMLKIGSQALSGAKTVFGDTMGSRG
jgi:hypothetical protein